MTLRTERIEHIQKTFGLKYRWEKALTERGIIDDKFIIWVNAYNRQLKIFSKIDSELRCFQKIYTDCKDSTGKLISNHFPVGAGGGRDRAQSIDHLNLKT